ncbi:MAG: hypothetical protein KDC92_04090 [Bacteroidetes bacterium]|nr:hypothetical protein [Bacteroidota bacterium]
MVFELVDYVNWDIDTTSAERCFIDHQEVQRLFYKSTSSVFKRLTIFRDGGASFKWETRERGESFSYEDLKNSDFMVWVSVFYDTNDIAGRIVDEINVNNTRYTNVYHGLKWFKCDTLGSNLDYSRTFGFLEVYDACKNERFTLVKD